MCGLKIIKVWKVNIFFNICLKVAKWSDEKYYLKLITKLVFNVYINYVSFRNMYYVFKCKIKEITAS